MKFKRGDRIRTNINPYVNAYTIVREDKIFVGNFLRYEGVFKPKDFAIVEFVINDPPGLKQKYIPTGDIEAHPKNIEDLI